MTRRLLLVVTLLAGSSCADASIELDPKDAVVGTDWAAVVPRVAQDASALCRTGEVPVAFARPGDAFSYPLFLSRADLLRVEVVGDPRLDTVLGLFGPEGPAEDGPLALAAWDDDGGEGRLSRLDGYHPDVPGWYFLLLGSPAGDAEGTARLTVSLNALPGCLTRTGPAQAVTGCTGCCGLTKAKTKVIMAGADDYTALATEEAAFAGRVVRLPDGGPDLPRHAYALAGSDAPPLLRGTPQDVSDLAIFEGCLARVVGKVWDSGAGPELWPGTASFDP